MTGATWHAEGGTRTPKPSRAHACRPLLHPAPPPDPLVARVEDPGHRALVTRIEATSLIAKGVAAYAGWKAIVTLLSIVLSWGCRRGWASSSAATRRCGRRGSPLWRRCSADGASGSLELGQAAAGGIAELGTFDREGLPSRSIGLHSLRRAHALVTDSSAIGRPARLGLTRPTRLPRDGRTGCRTVPVQSWGPGAQRRPGLECRWPLTGDLQEVGARHAGPHMSARWAR